MKEMNAEAVGGPADGRQYDISEEAQRIIIPSSLGYLVYLRTDNFDKNGKRLFKFAPQLSYTQEPNYG